MNKTIKFILFFIITAIFAIMLPNYSKAATTAHDEESLNSVISSADSGVTITLQNDITVTKPIVIAKELTIDGNGHNVVGSNDWTSTSGNQTMFTAQFSSAKLTLKNIQLKNGPKYGVQSYDGATVILNNVSITGFRYGGVLANGGYVEVIDLHLGYNGTGSNNGIEIDKGPSATNNPTLVMNGTLTSDSTENIVRPATNGNLTEFTVTNTDSTTNKVVIAGDKVVFTDENNNVISESAIPESATPNTDEPKVIVTIMVGGEEAKQITVDEGSTITADFLKSNITVAEGYEVEGFYTDEAYTNKFDFATPLNADVTIYARIAEISQEKPEEEPKPIPDDDKDEVPQTGVESYIGISVLAMTVALAGIIYLKKKEV